MAGWRSAGLRLGLGLGLGRVESKVVDSQTSSKVSVISVCVVVHVSLGVGWSRTSDDGVT